MGAKPPESDVEYVGFWMRFVASVIDTILVAAITFPVLIKMYEMRHAEPGSFSLVQGPADFLLSYVVPAVLVIGFWHFKLATPGKMAISAIVVDAESFDRPSTVQLAVRYAGYFLSTIFLFMGFLWIGVDKRKQGWHDKIARTVVIRGKSQRQIDSMSSD
jgi:uncharacterized RDD family membrane protein YckC